MSEPETPPDEWVHRLPKLTVRVRFPSSAPEDHPWSERVFRERPGSTAINCGLIGRSTGLTTFGAGRDLRSVSRASRAAAIASSATRLSERAARARPITHCSRQIAARPRPRGRRAGLAPDRSGHSAGRPSRVPEPVWTRSGGSDQSRQTTYVPGGRRGWRRRSSSHSRGTPLVRASVEELILAVGLPPRRAGC